MKNSIRVACLTMVLTVLAQGATHADTTSLDAVSLDTVTVYATLSAQPTFDVPAIVSKVDANALGTALSGDIADLLEFTPGVEVDNGPRRNGQTLSIRGFDSQAVLTLIDGRRQNFESAHDGNFFIDPSLLKSVEIVHGTASSIYGGGAIGGVVAFETKDATDLLDSGETTGAMASFGYRSGSKEHASTVTGYGRTESWDWLGSFAYRNSGDIKQGDGSKLDADDTLLSGLVKAGHTFEDFHTLKFHGQLLNNDGQEPNNGTTPVDPSNPIVNKKVQDNQFSLKHMFENPNNSWLNSVLHIYYNTTEVEEKDITGTNAGRLQSRKLKTLGFTASNQTKLVMHDTFEHTFSYGFEIYNNKQTGSSSTAGIRAGVPDAKADTYGFYLQDAMALKTSIGKFLIIPALRFDQYESKDKLGNAQDENKISPKFSLSYKPTKNTMLFGSWAQAFRAPSMTELYPTGRHFPGVPRRFPDNNFKPNPKLKPETVTTIELGLGLDFDNVLIASDRAKIKGAWFTNNGKNFIVQEINIAQGVTQFLNIPNAKLTGWELEAHYQLPSVQAKVGLSYVKAKNDDTGEYLFNNVPLTLVTDISYKLNSAGNFVGWRSRLVDANDKVGSNDIATDGYAVHNLYYRWQPNDTDLSLLAIDVGIDNIFKKAYKKRGGSLYEEGRSYTVKVSYKW